MFCEKCGKEISETATFCSGCGNKIESAYSDTENEKSYKILRTCYIVAYIFAGINCCIYFGGSYFFWPALIPFAASIAVILLVKRISKTLDSKLLIYTIIISFITMNWILIVDAFIIQSKMKELDVKQQELQ